jgi:hypothetical protein
MCAYKSSLKRGSVVIQLSSFHKKQVETNHKYMSSLIDIVLYLAKQGIAFRGHNENLDSLNQGTFIILLNYFYLNYLNYIKLMFSCNNINTILGNYKEMCYMVFSKFMPDFKNVYENKINHTSWKVLT